MATSNYRTIQTNFTEGVQFVKNYIPNATFSNGSVNNWSKFTTTLTSGLPTGTLTLGTAGSITTFAPTTTTPISGSASMQIGSSAAWAAGQGVITDEFTIEREDLGKPLTFSLSFEAITNPLNANWSGILGSQTFAVYIYDATVGAWVQPSGFLGMNQNSGVGQVMGSFQTSVTSGQKYRLAIIALQSSSGAITLNVDNVFLGKETSTVGTPVTDFISYTPTCNWTSGYTITGQYRRIGDSIECIVKLTCTGAPLAASETTFSIPSGLSIDTTKLLSPAQGAAPTYGDAIGYDISVTNLYLFRCQYWTTSTVKLFYQSASTGQESAVTTAVPPTWSTNDTIIARFQVPIVGFSSSVEMSNATDTRVIVANCAVNTGTSVTAATPINFDSIITDNTGSVTPGTGTWKFRAPVSGFYEVSTSFSTGTLNNVFQIFKNAIVYRQIGYTVGSSGSNFTSSGSTIIQLNAGDYIDIRPNNTQTLTTGLGTGGSVSTSNWISINRLSGPSVIAASDTIAASYWCSANVSASTSQPINYDSKEFDLTGSVTTGSGWKFTAPISGTYSIGYFYYPGNINTYFLIYKNNSIYKTIGFTQVITGGQAVSGNSLIRLNAGDYIDFRPSTAATMTGGVQTNNNTNMIYISRIGN